MRASSNSNIIDNPDLSFIGMTQPTPFIPLYRQMTQEEDGLLDRALICQTAPERKSTGVVGDLIERLNRQHTIKVNLRGYHSRGFVPDGAERKAQYGKTGKLIPNEIPTYS